ncbi:MAG: LysR family transcriptional regulator [Kofleriaceae bacterium]
MAKLQDAPEGPRWDDVRIFLAVHRQRTLAGAAQKLGVDISTVSRRLAAFEDELGERLFDRTREGLVPAQTAERVLAAAEQMEAAHARFTREASAVENLVEGIVRVTTAPGISSTFIAPALVKLRKRYPKLAIELDAGVGARDLTRHEADIAVRSVRSAGAELVTTKLGSSRWFAVSNGKLRPAKVQSWSDVPWIQWDRNMASFHAAKWIAQHVPSSQIALRTSDFMSQLNACKSGLGVMLCPNPYIETLGLQALEYAPALSGSTEAWPVDDLWLVGHRALRDVPRISAVWDFLVEELRG